MKNKLKKILSLFMCILIISGTMICAGAATTLTVTSNSPEGQPQMDILHMQRTVKESGTGYDVELISYLDDTLGAEVNLDVVLVLDGSGSMGVNQKEDVINAVYNIADYLQSISSNNRIGIVSYSTTVNNSATTDSLVYTNTNCRATLEGYLTGFGGYKTMAGSTATNLGMQRAKELLANTKISGRKQVCILITDGVPTLIYAFNDSLANSAIEASSDMKAAGVVVYAIQAYFKLGENNETKMNTFLSKITSFYNADATEMDNGTPVYTDVEKRDQFVVSINNYDALKRNLSGMVVRARLYPFILDSSSITQDVVTPYFKATNASCVVQKPTYNTSKIITGWSNSSALTATISGQRVYATGFNYTSGCVSYENRDYAGRVVLTYHIEPITNFFGGNGVPTNIPGDTSDDKYTTGGAGIYCNGEFLKAFYDVPVNVPIKARTLTAQSSVNVSYGTNVDVDNYYNFNDLTTSANLLNGINNAFVNVTFSVSPSFDSSGASSAWKGNGKFTADGSDSKKKNFVVNAGEDYSEGALDWFNSYAATSESGDTIKFSYTVESAKGYIQGSVGDSASIKTASKTVRINAVSTYKVVFKYADGTPNGVTALPAEQTGSSESWAQSVVQTVEPKAGSSSNVGGVNYAFLGWGTPVVSRNGAVVTYTYTGSWKASDAGFTVNVYVMNTDAKDTSDSSYTLQSSHFLNGTIGGVINRTECDSFNETSYSFLKDCDGTALTKDSHTQSKDGDKYAASFKAASLVSGSDSILFDGDQAVPGTHSCDAYLCTGCGGVIEENALIDNADGTLSTNCPGCKSQCAVMRYSDFAINDEKSTKTITISTNSADNIIDIYIDRVPHKIEFSISYDDEPADNSAFSITALYGASISDTINNLPQAEKEAYLNFAYMEDQITPVEERPYYDFSCVSFPYFEKTNTGINFINKNAYYTQNWVYISEILENGSVLSDTIQAYDISGELAFQRIKYDIVVTKDWNENVSQKDKQNCVFGLYELDDTGTYNLLIRFVIGVDESSKTIKNLVAGKTYVLEEEEWSYKTNSDWKRGNEGGNKFNNSSKSTLRLTCTNSNDSGWTYSPTVEKGVRNRLSVDKIVAEPIKKTMVGGKK